MPLPVIANVDRVTLNWRSSESGIVAANVMHFGTNGASPSALADDLLNTIDAAGGTLFEALSANMFIESVDVIPLDGTTATVIVPADGATNTNLQGQSSGGEEPAVAVTVSLKTDTRGRRHRGRIYLPCVGESAITDGFIDSTRLANMQTAWDDIVTGGLVGGELLKVASYRDRAALNVTSCVVRRGASTQRRRQSRLSFP
jgi:hypothetical protein